MATLSKKNYQAIANILKGQEVTNSWQAEEMRQRIGKDLAVYFASDNPRFREGQFLQASQVSLLPLDSPSLEGCYCPKYENHLGRCNGNYCNCH